MVTERSGGINHEDMLVMQTFFGNVKTKEKKEHVKDMSDKSILVIDTPKNCEECRCSTTVYGKLLCPPRNIFVIKGERDCSCPLKPVPDKLDPAKVRDAHEAACIEAYNQCIEKLLGGTNE